MKRHAIGIVMLTALATWLGWLRGLSSIRQAHWHNGRYFPLPLNDGTYAAFTAAFFGGIALAVGVLFAVTWTAAHYNMRRQSA